MTLRATHDDASPLRILKPCVRRREPTLDAERREELGASLPPRVRRACAPRRLGSRAEGRSLFLLGPGPVPLSSHCTSLRGRDAEGGRGRRLASTRSGGARALIREAFEEGLAKLHVRRRWCIALYPRIESCASEQDGSLLHRPEIARISKGRGDRGGSSWRDRGRESLARARVRLPTRRSRVPKATSGVSLHASSYWMLGVEGDEPMSAHRADVGRASWISRRLRSREISRLLQELPRRQPHRRPSGRRSRSGDQRGHGGAPRATGASPFTEAFIDGSDPRPPLPDRAHSRRRRDRDIVPGPRHVHGQPMSF